MLSKRIQELKPSVTLALAAKARQLKTDGKDVISLTVGEPDWTTYEKAKEAGKAAIDTNKTTYTPAAGIPQLRQAVAQLTSHQLGFEVDPNQVTVGAGAKYIIYAALTAVLDPGDEVIIPSPYWVSYPTMVELAGGRAHIVNCGEETQFKLTADQLENEINEKTKVVLLNSPSNPTGAEYTKEELKSLIEVFKKYPNIVILCDDIYNQLSFNETGLSPHLLQIEPSFFDRCLCVNGMSKAYAMTGWRMGWVVGPEKVVKAIGSFLSQTTGASSSISQWASVTAINDCKEDVKQALVALKERKEFFLEKISTVPGMRAFQPQGAFYLWVNIQDWIGQTFGGEKLLDSRRVAELLLEKENLAVVPGQEFGLDGYLRLSFAASLEDLERATERLKHFTS
jgi:aspartate aminotransferase